MLLLYIRDAQGKSGQDLITMVAAFVERRGGVIAEKG